MGQSAKPGARILGWVFAHLGALFRWIVPVLLIFPGSAPNSLLAQIPPAVSNVPTVSGVPAEPVAANPPATGNSPPADANAKPPPTGAELQRAAIAQQRAAIRRQAENLGLWLMPLDGKPPT